VRPNHRYWTYVRCILADRVAPFGALYSIQAPYPERLLAWFEEQLPSPELWLPHRQGFLVCAGELLLVLFLLSLTSLIFAAPERLCFF
jgi:hypothetical protein